MIAFYFESFRTLGSWAFQLRCWAHCHPWRARAWLLALTILYIILCPLPAYAAGFLPGDTDFVDSSGNKFTQYSHINIDGGDLIHPGKVIVDFFVQLIWILQYFFTGLLLWLFDFLLSFTWVEWLATPFNTIAVWLGDTLGEFNWIPFALTISAAVGGIALLIGRVSGGLLEMLIAAIVAVLAVTVFANPVATLTAAGGVLEHAQRFGGELAASIVVDDAMVGQTTETMSAAVTTQLMEIFVRTPYQVISYSMVLPPECQGYFDTFIQTGEPQQSLRDCAPPLAVASFDNPSAMNIMSAIISGLGVGMLLLFAMAIAILLVIAVFFFLVAAVKMIYLSHLAILPVDRNPLWKSVSDAFMGCVSIVVMTVCLALYLRLTTFIMDRSGYLPHLMRMALLVIFLIVIIYLLIRARRATIRSGRNVAKQASRLGLSTGKTRDGRNSLMKLGAIAQIADAGRRLHRTRTPVEFPLARSSGGAVGVKGSLSSPPSMLPPGTPPHALPAGAGPGPVPPPTSWGASGILMGAAKGALTGGSVGAARGAIGHATKEASMQAATQLRRRTDPPHPTIETGPRDMTPASAARNVAPASAARDVTPAEPRPETAPRSTADSPQSKDLGDLRVLRVQEELRERFTVDSEGKATVKRAPAHNISSLPPLTPTAPSARLIERRAQLEPVRVHEPA